MRLPVSLPPILTLLLVPVFAALLAVAAAAEPNPGTPPDSPAAAEARAPAETTLPEAGDAAATGEKAATEEAKPESGSAAVEGDVKPEDSPEDGAEALAPETPKSSIVINIDKSTQEMTVFKDGVELYTWPVSTGTRGYSTPSGTFTASSMNEMWYSRQWDNAPMPHAIFFTKKGHAIHGTTEEHRLGQAASHGCVRLSRANAKTLFHLVKETGLENTQVVLTGVTKGGEGPKVASPTPPRQYEYYGDYPPPWFEGGPRYVQPNKKKRRGLFGRRWFQPDAQGYYQPPRYRRGY